MLCPCKLVAPCKLDWIATMMGQGQLSNQPHDFTYLRGREPEPKPRRADQPAASIRRGRSGRPWCKWVDAQGHLHFLKIVSIR